MRIESQVCSLEQAKRLKELGITQQSLFFMDSEETIMVCVERVSIEREFAVPVPLQKSIVNNSVVAVFTVAELGVMLPDYCISYVNGLFGYEKHPMRKYKWLADTNDDYNKIPMKLINEGRGNTEAEARAALLIHLLENKLVTPEECNKRLNHE